MTESSQLNLLIFTISISFYDKVRLPIRRDIENNHYGEGQNITSET